MELKAIRKDQRGRLDGTDVVIPCLVPAYRAEYDEWKRVKAGKILTIKIASERELNHHNQFFAICAYTFENLPESFPPVKSFDTFRKIVLIEIGYCDVFTKGKDVYRVPFSLSFDDCSEEEFMSRVWFPGIDYCGSVIGLSRDEIMSASQEWRDKKKAYSRK